MENSSVNPGQPPTLVWWAIWGSITAAFFVAIGIFEVADVSAHAPRSAALLALVPFTASATIRFILIPRATAAPMRFTLFILGLATAEAGGFIALIIGAPWKTPLAAAAIVLMILHIPAFIRAR